MAVRVKGIVLWRKETENQSGVLAGSLEPFAKGGVNLQVVMGGYRYPGNEQKAAIELYAVAVKKLTKAAQAADLSPHLRLRCW